MMTSTCNHVQTVDRSSGHLHEHCTTHTYFGNGIEPNDWPCTPETRTPVITSDRARQHAEFGKPNNSASARRYQVQATSAKGDREALERRHGGFLAYVEKHVNDADDTLNTNDMRDDLDRLATLIGCNKQAISACYTTALGRGILFDGVDIPSTDTASGNTSGNRASLYRVDRVALHRAMARLDGYLPHTPRTGRNAAVIARNEIRAIAEQANAGRSTSRVSTPVDAADRPTGPVRLAPEVAAGITLHTLADDDMALF